MTSALALVVPWLLLPATVASPVRPLPAITDLDRITVSGSETHRSASATMLPGDAVSRVAATHPNELFQRVPGAWISRGSGQEQLTAIRSPVLAGTGACGAFLWSEDGVPIRPVGFCNVNNLSELDADQAAAVEVLRGPGTALQGSNALHGVINVRTRSVSDSPSRAVSVEAGPHDYRRLQATGTIGDDQRGWRGEASLVSTDSFRVDEGFEQQKIRLRRDVRSDTNEWSTALSLSNLRQRTAGFIVGKDAYRDDAKRQANLNPEAFRNAWSARLSTRYHHDFVNGGSLQLVPFVRSDGQQFLQHFTPGKPLERNGSRSVGVLALVNQAWGDARLSYGVDTEWARGEVREIQAAPLTTGVAAQRAIRPTGVHYDYSALSRSVAVFADVARPLGPGEIELGLRAESLSYDYDNRARDGNTRADGSVCGFGGCLFNRPADREDRFTRMAPKLSYRQNLRHGQAWLRLASGFRFPQAGELYRLQRGQDVTDLHPETLDMLEAGWRGQGVRGSLELVAYTGRKENFIFRDANGFNASDGRTTHRGVELAFDLAPVSGWALAGNASYSIQRYAFDRALSAGEAIGSGNEIDTAPRWLADARLSHDSPRLGRFELEAVYQGAYFLDAGNQSRYPGHVLGHLRWSRPLTRGWRVDARVMNLANRRYAERADIAFGEYRYFPGEGRALFLGVGYRVE
jgi:iron complex outermembrane recepter protein